MIWPSYGENEANTLFLATMQTLPSYFYLAGLAKFFMNMIANDNSTMVIITSICNDDDCTNYTSSDQLFSSSDSGEGGREQGVG